MRPRAPIAVLLAALLAACQPPPPRQQLDAEQVQQQAKKLAGLCMQGALLASLVQARRVPHAYPYVEQQAVTGEAGRALAELARPAGREVLQAQQDLQQLAVDLQATVSRIAVVQDDDAALQALGARLRVMAARAERLGRPAA